MGNICISQTGTDGIKIVLLAARNKTRLEMHEKRKILPQFRCFIWTVCPLFAVIIYFLRTVHTDTILCCLYSVLILNMGKTNFSRK
jgi:hypothetical protein